MIIYEYIRILVLDFLRYLGTTYYKARDRRRHQTGFYDKSEDGGLMDQVMDVVLKRPMVTTTYLERIEKRSQPKSK